MHSTNVKWNSSKVNSNKSVQSTIAVGASRGSQNWGSIWGAISPLDIINALLRAAKRASKWHSIWGTTWPYISRTRQKSLCAHSQDAIPNSDRSGSYAIMKGTIKISSNLNVITRVVTRNITPDQTLRCILESMLG